MRLCRMLLYLLVALLCLACYGQSEAPKLALASIKTLYVNSLGEGEDADMARERLIAGLVNTGRFSVVDDPAAADAQIVGRYRVTSVQRGAIVSNSWGTYGNVGPVSYTSAVIRLVDANKNTIWAFDSERDKKRWGAIKTLLKAIEQEEKQSKKRNR